MTKWILSAIFAILLTISGAVMSGMQTKVNEHDRILYDQGRELAAVKSAVEAQTEVAKEQREIMKEMRDAVVQAAKANRR